MPHICTYCKTAIIGHPAVVDDKPYHKHHAPTTPKPKARKRGNDKAVKPVEDKYIGS